MPNTLRLPAHASRLTGLRRLALTGEQARPVLRSLLACCASCCVQATRALDPFQPRAPEGPDMAVHLIFRSLYWQFSDGAARERRQCYSCPYLEVLTPRRQGVARVARLPDLGALTVRAHSVYIGMCKRGTVSFTL